MQVGDRRNPVCRGCYHSSVASASCPGFPSPSCPWFVVQAQHQQLDMALEPQKTPQLGVGAGKGPAWMCGRLLAGLLVGFRDSHQLLCSLSRARHAQALSHPAPRMGFCPDISFSGGSWAFTAGAAVLRHMEGGSSARALAGGCYKRCRCGKPPAAVQTLRQSLGALGTHGAVRTRLSRGSFSKPIHDPSA